MTMISVRFQGKPLNITAIQVYAATTDAKEAEVYQLYEDLQDLLELAPKKDVLFITGDGNAKVGSQEIPRITGKFDLGTQKGAGQRLTEFVKRSHRSQQTPFSSSIGDDSSHGNRQMVSTEGRLAMFFAVKAGDALCSLQEQTGADCGSDHQLLIENSSLN